MKLGFEETQARYISGSQSARAWTERWTRDWVYCPNCGSLKIEQFENNRPVADFYCASCQEEYELKSQKKVFGSKIIDGAYQKMRDRLTSSNNPNLLLMNYDYTNLSVTDLVVVPKQFFVLEIIEERKALSTTARRAGWIGCNILLNQIPESGKISIIQKGQVQPKSTVISKWRRTLFLRQEDVHTRGWLIEVMKCAESIGREEFSLEEMYEFEDDLAQKYPNNRHVRQKVRQQLQVLRDRGYIDFICRGRYRLRSHA